MGGQRDHSRAVLSVLWKRKDVFDFIVPSYRHICLFCSLPDKRDLKFYSKQTKVKIEKLEEHIYTK